MALEIIAPFQPLEWQIDPWKDTSPTLLLTGSAGGGKSRLAAEKVHGFCLRYPGTTGLVLRKAYEYASKSVVPFLNYTVIKDDSRVNFRATDRTFHYSNGSIIYAGGMRDSRQREAIRSIGGEGQLDIVWMEEANAFTEEDYNEILARMRGTASSWTQVILSTNPDTPTHWIKRRLMDGGEAAVYYSSNADNPHNPDSYRERLEDLTGVQYKRLVLGQWVQAEGAIYSQFSDERHVLERDGLPEFHRVIRAIDFGYTNPLVCQWWGLDNDSRMYLYREIYHTRRLVEDHAEDIKDLSRNESIEATICDHDAEGRATLESRGISTRPAEKTVQAGIQAVQKRLRDDDDGSPRLFVVRGALVELDVSLEEAKKPTSTLEEFPGYVWRETREGKAEYEEPRKLNDHGMDAMRYAVAYVDQVGGYAWFGELGFA